MKTFEFDREEVNALVEILFHYINKFIDGTPSPDIYKQAISLYRKLKPKTIEISGWIVVTKIGAYGVFKTEEQAKEACTYFTDGTDTQVIQIDWEQEV